MKLIKPKSINNKKGMENAWWMIATIVMVIVVVVIILLWFRKGGDSAFGTIDDQISGAGDCDKDGASNLFDDCPCDPALQDLTEEQKESEKSNSDVCGEQAATETKCGADTAKCHKFS